MMYSIQHGKSYMTARTPNNHRVVIGSYNATLMRHLHYSGVNPSNMTIEYRKDVTTIQPIAHMLIANGHDLHEPSHIYVNALLHAEKVRYDSDTYLSTIRPGYFYSLPFVHNTGIALINSIKSDFDCRSDVTLMCTVIEPNLHPEYAKLHHSR